MMIRMLPVTKIQHFCTKDGPGVRTTVFLKGCPLRCLWCHNPETWSAAPKFFCFDKLCIGCGGCVSVCPHGAHRITEDGHTLDRSVCSECGKCTKICPSGALEECYHTLSAEEIFIEVMKDAAFYGETGGVTFSGGEPTMHADELLPLLRQFRDSGIHTALETCGYFDHALLPELTSATDLFLWDIKDTDEQRHLSGTGVSCGRIIENLKAADALGAKTVLRCIMLKNVNLCKDHLTAVASIFASLKHCIGVELIPYHTYGVSKYAQLGWSGVPHEEWIPSAEDIREAEAFLRQYAPVLSG